jgi:hypothetical protein
MNSRSRSSCRAGSGNRIGRIAKGRRGAIEIPQQRDKLVNPIAVGLKLSQQ